MEIVIIVQAVRLEVGMYESCPYGGGGLELKRCGAPTIKSEDLAASAAAAAAAAGGEWYRFSTFQQLKQSVEKAKAALSASTAFTDLSASFREDDKRNITGTFKLYHPVMIYGITNHLINTVKSFGIPHKVFEYMSILSHTNELISIEEH